MNKAEERELARVAVELTFRAEIEIVRDDSDSTPEEIARELYEENADLDELLVRGEKELDALRDLDRRSSSVLPGFHSGANIDAEIDFDEVREPVAGSVPGRSPEELVDKVIEVSPWFTDDPEGDLVIARVELDGRTYATTFSKEFLASWLRKLLGFDRARERLDQVPRSGFDKLAAIENFVVDELDAIGDEFTDGEAKRVLVAIREILNGEVKP
jgi:hypothetical protein